MSCKLKVFKMVQDDLNERKDQLNTILQQFVLVVSNLYNFICTFLVHSAFTPVMLGYRWGLILTFSLIHIVSHEISLTKEVVMFQNTDATQSRFIHYNMLYFTLHVLMSQYYLLIKINSYIKNSSYNLCFTIVKYIFWMCQPKLSGSFITNRRLQYTALSYITNITSSVI